MRNENATMHLMTSAVIISALASSLIQSTSLGRRSDYSTCIPIYQLNTDNGSLHPHLVHPIPVTKTNALNCEFTKQPKATGFNYFQYQNEIPSYVRNVL